MKGFIFLEYSVSDSSEILSTVFYKFVVIILILELGTVGEVNINLSIIDNLSKYSTFSWE